MPLVATMLLSPRIPPSTTMALPTPACASMPLLAPGTPPRLSHRTARAAGVTWCLAPSSNKATALPTVPSAPLTVLPSPPTLLAISTKTSTAPLALPIALLFGLEFPLRMLPNKSGRPLPPPPLASPLKIPSTSTTLLTSTPTSWPATTRTKSSTPPLPPRNRSILSPLTSPAPSNTAPKAKCKPSTSTSPKLLVALLPAATSTSTSSPTT